LCDSSHCTEQASPQPTLDTLLSLSTDVLYLTLFLLLPKMKMNEIRCFLIFSRSLKPAMKDKKLRRKMIVMVRLLCFAL